MKMKPLLIALLCGLATAATGYVAGRVIFAPDTGSAESTENSSPMKVSGSGSRGGATGDMSAIPGLPTELQTDVDELQAALKRGGIADFLDRMEIVEDESTRAQLLLEAAPNFTNAQFEDLFTLLVEDDDRFQDLFGDEEIAILLVEDWVNLDADSAIEFGFQQEGDMTMLSAIGFLFLAAHDYERAEEKLASMKTLIQERFGEFMGDQESDFADQFLGMGLALKDPIETLRRMREDGLNLEEYDTLFEMNNQIGEPMLEEILLFEDPRWQRELAEELFKNWGKRDPMKALEGLERFREAASGDPASAFDTWKTGHVEIYRQWARIDPISAMDHLLKSTKGDAYSHDAYTRVLRELAKVDPARAFSLVEKGNPAHFSSIANWDIPASQKLDMMNDLLFAGIPKQILPETLQEFLTEDPVETMNWLMERKDSLELAESESNLGKTSGRALAKLDLKEALQVIDQMPAGMFRDGYIEGLVVSGARVDPLAVAELLNRGNLSNFENQNSLQTALVGAWVSQDPNSAIQYAANLGGGALKNAVDQWAKDDITTAFNYFAENGDPAVGRFVQEPEFHAHWIQQDAFGGAAVIANLPPESAAEAMAVYVTQWAGKAPEEASVFLSDAMEPGPVRDAAIVSLAASIAADDPASARQWINAISDPTLRAEAMQAVQNP
ncbi:MAG: hypothetical protein AAGA58_03895 [Verrucomicrobiota bacterium]